MEDHIGRRVDALYGNYMVEVKHGTHSIRNLRAALLDLIYTLGRYPERRALLVLVDSRITQDRVHEELEKASSVMQPGLTDRLDVGRVDNGEYGGFPDQLGNDFFGWLSKHLSRERTPTRGGGSYYEILQVILYKWLTSADPMTRKLLMDITGFSYPTVSGALKQLGPYVLELPDLSFIRELDPALVPVKDLLQPVDVAVHIVKRRESFFAPGQGGISWAGPVECLMDLYEAGLNRQADEFLEYMIEKRLEHNERR